jgi:formate hydrogenlyase subunit 6/NADH:ubiquinone oxidoreductase subunit I
MRLLPALRICLSAQGHPHHAARPNGQLADRSNAEKMPQEFEINMLRCIYCGFCQEVCPEEAIFLQKDYSLTGLSRRE